MKDKVWPGRTAGRRLLQPSASFSPPQRERTLRSRAVNTQVTSFISDRGRAILKVFLFLLKSSTQGTLSGHKCPVGSEFSTQVRAAGKARESAVQGLLAPRMGGGGVCEDSGQDSGSVGMDRQSRGNKRPTQAAGGPILSPLRPNTTQCCGSRR